MAGQGLMTILGAFVGVVVAESGRLRPSAVACVKTGSIGQMQTPAELIKIIYSGGTQLKSYTKKYHLYFLKIIQRNNESIILIYLFLNRLLLAVSGGRPCVGYFLHGRLRRRYGRG